MKIAWDFYLALESIAIAIIFAILSYFFEGLRFYLYTGKFKFEKKK